MTGLRSAVLAALLVGCFVGLTACGEDDNNAFKEDYNRAVRPLSELNSDIEGSINGAAGKGNDAIAAQFDDLAERANQTYDNLAELDPPDDAKEDFETLLASVQGGATALEDVAAAAREADPTAARAASNDLVRSGQEIKDAETALRRAVDG